MNIWDKVLKWIKDVLPSVTAVGGFIYNYMLGKVRRLQNKNEQLELELEYKENEDAVEEFYEGDSDSDVIRDAIRDGSGDPGDSSE